MTLPENLRTLHAHEEVLRRRAAALVAANSRLALHLHVIARAMNLSDLLRQYPTKDEGRKVVQALGMRVFTAFCAGISLAFSGYGQNSALVLRDIVETTNLLDLFSGDGEAVERFRFAETKAELREFSPVKVRIALDRRDGRHDQRREAQYKMLSELAAHPTMKSGLLMRARKDGDLEAGPFVEPEFLEAVLCEMARVAVLGGEVLDRFLPEAWEGVLAARAAFSEVRRAWLASYPP